jgi:hypothetical protein
VPPQDWDWKPFPAPRWRFDSADGRYRVRYAASSARGMLRETFDPDRFISAQALDHWVVAVTVTGGLVDLRTDDTLDALGLDDQISTSRAPQVWAAAQRLGDLLWDEYAHRGRPAPAVVYRSRTTPQHNANLAFFQHSVGRVVSATRLRDLPALLDAAITADGFTVDL